MAGVKDTEKQSNREDLEYGFHVFCTAGTLP